MRRSVALLLALAGCQFAPARPVDDRDAGVERPLDANVPRDAGPGRDGGFVDAGFVDGGFVDGGPGARPPTVAIVDRAALPYDTVALQAMASDPDGDALTFAWSVTLPAGAVGGFGAFPGTDPTSTEHAPSMFVSEPGEYVVEVSVSDGRFVRSATARITVVGFERIEVAQPVEFETLTYDPNTETLWIGTTSDGLRMLEADELTAEDVECVRRTKVNAIAVTQTGAVGVATDDGLVVYDGDCRPLTAENTKARGITSIAGTEDFLLCGDPGVHHYDAATNAITATYTLDFASGAQKFRGAARDTAGAYWFGSDSNAPSDGVGGGFLPLPAEAPGIDLFPGANDKPNAVRAGPNRELWIAADRGIALVDLERDTRRTFIAGDGLEPAFSGKIEDAAIVPGEDVWFAAQGGVIRYKRDIGLMVTLPRGSFGLPGDAEMRGVAAAFDVARGRTVYLAGKAGLFVLRTVANSP